MKETWLSEHSETSSIILPDHLTDIVSRLAEYTHDIWVRERIRMGWSYGPERNDTLKQTPLLIPYDSLPEDEKLYDRKIVEEIIKGLILCGYEIKPVSEP